MTDRRRAGFPAAVFFTSFVALYFVVLYIHAMKYDSPDQRLYTLITTLPPQEVQNRLMRITDREIAISLIYMGDRERKVLLGFLGQAKRNRIRQEMAYVEHLRLRYPHYRLVIEQVIAVVSGRSDAAVRTYIRPVRD